MIFSAPKYETNSSHPDYSVQSERPTLSSLHPLRSTTTESLANLSSIAKGPGLLGNTSTSCQAKPERHTILTPNQPPQIVLQTGKRDGSGWVGAVILSCQSYDPILA